MTARLGKNGNGAAAGGRKVGLALAGGGPLGAVYEIGALLALNETLEGFDFHDADVYVGVSAGALVSSLLANGISPAEMARVFIQPRPGDPRFSPTLFMQPAFREYMRRGLSLPSLFLKSTARFLSNPVRNGLLDCYSDLTRAIPTAVFDNAPIERFLDEVFSNRHCTNDFRELDKQLFVVAVDLDTGQPIRFGASGASHVSISRAVQASTALPGLYPPVEIGGRYYVDGGLKRTLHASMALDEGVDLLFCVNPIVPFDAELAPEDEAKRHDRLVDGGLPSVLSQSFRSLIHSRMKVGMANYDTNYTHAKVVLFEPDRHDSRMFFSSFFSYANRENVCQHAYRTTRRDLRARRDELEPVLEAHGIRIRDKILADKGRQFSKPLERCQADVQRLGLYMNPTTNALSDTLDRLEHLIGGSSPRQAQPRD